MIRSRATLLLTTLGAVALGATLSACNPNSIGRPCVNPSGQDVKGTQISAPALECPSRLCLLQRQNGSTSGDMPDGSTSAGAGRATCTASCNHDNDCDPETTKYCKSGFACAVAVSTGPFCCQKVCICRDDLEVGFNVDANGNTITPAVCDPKTTSCRNK